MNFYDRLKDSISADHDAAENVFQPSLFSENFGLDDYKRYLLSNYLFFKSHETYFSTLRLPDSAGALINPSRAQLLARDLATFKINDLPELLPVSDPAIGRGIPRETVALGHVYVLAGSAMGAKMISGHFLKKPFIKDSGATAFLESYRTFDGRAWKGFKEALNEIEDEESCQAVIDAARRSFGIFAQSYRHASAFFLQKAF